MWPHHSSWRGWSGTPHIQDDLRRLQCLVTMKHPVIHNPSLDWKILTDNKIIQAIRSSSRNLHYILVSLSSMYKILKNAKGTCLNWCIQLVKVQQEHPKLPESYNSQNIRHGHTKQLQRLYLTMEKRWLKILWVGAETFIPLLHQVLDSLHQKWQLTIFLTASIPSPKTSSKWVSSKHSYRNLQHNIMPKFSCSCPDHEVDWSLLLTRNTK